jgi:hypothetical protein
VILEIPREEVDIHIVEVPVDIKRFPYSPAALTESYSEPDTERAVTVVVARVEVPVTPRVPPIDSLPVIVEVPTVEVLAVK